MGHTVSHRIKALALSVVSMAGLGAMTSPDLPIIDFSAASQMQWQSINDVVMGGRSRGRVSATEDGIGVFEGVVSLENNGGFASIRATIDTLDLSSYEGVRVRVRGDGKRYRLRLFDSERFDAVSHQAGLEAPAGRWITVEIPFDDFTASFRGQFLRDAPPLDSARIRQIGLMVADKQVGEFRLEIDWIRAYRREN